MNKNEKIVLKILYYIGISILFIGKRLFRIFAFLWILILRVENVYIRVTLWILLTSTFIFGGVFMYDNRENIVKEGIKGAMCIRFPKSCIKHEVKEEYYSGSGVLNN